MRERLSPGQARVLGVIRRCVENGAAPPTYRELCEEFGWKSTGTARDHLRALARKGYIELSQGRARQVRLLDNRSPAAQVPVIGRVVAGVPEEALEEFIGTLPVPRYWINGGRHFALRVSGGSMDGVGILDGDLVVVQATPTARDGDIVVVTIDGETTVKRLRATGPRLELVPENPRFKVIPIGSESVVVHGVVIGLVRHIAASRRRSKTQQSHGRHRA